MNKFVGSIEDDFDTQRTLEIMVDAIKSMSSFADLRDMVSIVGFRY